MLNWKVVTLSLGSFTAITYLLCVAYGLLAPAGLHPSWLLESILPGFRWLTFGSFLLGLVETTVYGAYAGVLYSVLHNAFWRRLAEPGEAGVSRRRAA